MCQVCRHPDRIAIEAALQAGRPLRALAADYPALNKSTIGRHRKACLAGATAGTSFAPGCNSDGEAAPLSLPRVRHGTRPIDETQKLDIALRMRARGCTQLEIARALNIDPSTVREIIRRATDNAIERVRSETVEELVAQHRAERDSRMQTLHAVLDVATRCNDVRTIVEIARELRHEAKENREWMRELGAFDRYRVLAAAHHAPRDIGIEIMQEGLREMAEYWAGLKRKEGSCADEELSLHWPEATH